MFFSKKLKNKKGQLLLEALFAIAVGGVVLGIGASLLIAGLQAANTSVERDVAQKLLNETFEAVRAVAFEDWQIIEDQPTGSSNPYHPELGVDTINEVIENYDWINHTGQAGSISFSSVSAYSPTNVWAGVQNLVGYVYHYNGRDWTMTDIGDFVIRDISTVSETETWVVGNDGNVWEFNNSTWTQHDGTGLWETANIHAVSAANSTTVWIGGASGNVWKYDGSTWTPHSGSGRWGVVQVNAVSALSDNVYIAANGGEVWQYDGSSWIDRSNSNWGSANISDISMAPLSDDSTQNVWVVGQGSAFKFNGSSWIGFDGDRRWDPDTPTEISAYGEDHVYLAADEQLWSYNGTDWAIFPNDEWNTLNSIHDISDRFSTELWIVGSNGEVNQLKPAKWKLTASSEDITLNDTTYTRSFIIEDVNRTSGDIDPAGTSDPSTKKVTATISWNGNTISSEEYISRWQRDSCFHTEWSTDEETAAVHLDCPTVDYESATNINFQSGGASLSILLPLIDDTGTLTSTIFDTGADNPIYRSIYWNGNMQNGNDIARFQIATSDCTNGDDDYPDCNDGLGWRYFGENCGTWLSWQGPQGAVTNATKDINCSSLDGGRYFRYKIELVSGEIIPFVSGTTPRVDDLLITWTP